MSDLKTAAQQALEALESDHYDIQLRAAIALRAALAEPVQEPVANEIHGCHGGDGSTMPEQPAQENVKLPTTATEAELMAKAGLMWLEQNAPDRLLKPVQEPERATVGPHLQKQARRLLEQLAANRPRRALDVDSTRRLLEVISAPGETDKLIADLIRSAWEWGVSCEVDDVRWGEAGDSHNQWLRDRTNDAATRLHAAMLTSGKKPNKQAEPDSPKRRCGGPGCDLKCCQPVQEPVALETVYETIIHWDEGGGKRSRRELARRIVDLYTSPPQRKPLTEEEIDSLFRTVASPVMFARAVERAHGIT